ncbi:hypothetical protein SERLA73DRAFT_175638 [Serpula lacrymans var. lacrymans S7.3]|uniref:Uncharacterized protein n=2 Tax=Serpula lacrymans var. lacrymans TaxID=341189 RepID=F8PL31_SERL3|nr:uncharacterized protein SERLADRAFT_413177 [Serpula lacrymans var. lacrymans S7.9]EGO03939.1 hypothetical protein SERLA73DRAFT_175638 [Serpula lacrymans var. lacrymans S7.3]EGO29860.1 hypothetical protein SERLADRAFT_413177 [Serpula lacrymans var. lacrymans S7.9]
MHHPIEPPLNTNTKDNRGFEHTVTGYLLCPIDYDWSDVSVRKNIRERHPDFLVTADAWPAFLYPTPGQHLLEDPSRGLLRLQLLLKAFKMIFTSPSSARGDENCAPAIYLDRSHSRGEKSTRSHVASLMGMRTVTPRAIAYAAVQLRFALSNVSSWRQFDEDFDLEEFYKNILDWFEGPATENHQKDISELLLWWDGKIFGRNRHIVIPREIRKNMSVARSLAHRTGMRV